MVEYRLELYWKQHHRNSFDIIVSLAFPFLLDKMCIRDSSLAEYAAIIEGYHAVFENDIKGAAYCGIHMEGPFLNPCLLYTSRCV